MSYPTFQQFPSQTKQDESLDNFWNGDSSLEIGFGLDDPYGMEVNNSQPPKLHTSANSSNLASLISGNEPNYFDGISSFHSSSNTPATAPSSHRSSPVSSVGGRTKLSRDNSYDTLEIGHSHGILLNREKYRDHHFHSDYPSDGDQPHHNLTHGIEIDHDGRGIESHPSKFPRLSERGQYDSTVDDTESSHDCGNSDSGSVVGNYSHVVPQPGQPLGRSISDCSLLSEIHISPTSQSVPIHHSFSCNSLPGPTMKSSSLTQIMAHTPHHGHPSPHSSIHLNSFHIGGHSGHSHSSLLHHRALVNSHESKLHRHHSGDHSHHTQSQSRQPTNQHMSPASISSTHTSPRPLVAFHQPLQILRFTKVSSQSWTMHIDKVYQIELFLNKLPKCVVYLLDDKSFPQQEWNDHKLDTLNQDPLSSCNNLQKELELRKVLVTSWPPSLHDQLVGFVNNWNALLLQHEEQKSLHEERLSPPLPLLHEPPSLLGLWRNGPISLPHSSSSSPGILAYEISLQLGVIIRADPFTEENTMWNLLYLQDILHTTPEVHISTWSCYDFFCHLFPHFHHFLINLTHEHGGVDLTRLAIKYCSHPMTSSSSSNGENQRDPMMMCLPPSHSPFSAYQTIGVLNEPAIKIISR